MQSATTTRRCRPCASLSTIFVLAFFTHAFHFTIDWVGFLPQVKAYFVSTTELMDGISQYFYALILLMSRVVVQTRQLATFFRLSLQLWNRSSLWPSRLFVLVQTPVVSLTFTRNIFFSLVVFLTPWHAMHTPQLDTQPSSACIPMWKLKLRRWLAFFCCRCCHWESDSHLSHNTHKKRRKQSKDSLSYLVQFWSRLSVLTKIPNW